MEILPQIRGLDYEDISFFSQCRISNMVEEYTSNQVGIEFSGQLKQKDIEDYSGVKPLDLTNYSRVYIKFWRPDGTVIMYTAELRDDTKLMDTDILYKVDTKPILNQEGDWSYTIGAEYTDGSVIESSERELFWVI